MYDNCSSYMISVTTAIFLHILSLLPKYTQQLNEFKQA